LRATGKIENLSLGGCRIQMADRHGFRQGEKVEITFIVRQLPLRVQASIRQLHPGNGVGVVFTLLSERGKRQLLDLIDELAELLRDQVDGLIQYQSSLAAVPAERRNDPRSGEPREPREKDDKDDKDDKDATRSAGRPVPIDRNSR
jgi:hypothetical protein